MLVKKRSESWPEKCTYDLKEALESIPVGTSLLFGYMAPDVVTCPDGTKYFTPVPSKVRFRVVSVGKGSAKKKALLPTGPCWVALGEFAPDGCEFPARLIKA